MSKDISAKVIAQQQAKETAWQQPRLPKRWRVTEQLVVPLPAFS
jgi:hypothetical protein